MKLRPCTPWVTGDEIEADPRVCPSSDLDIDFDALAERATETMWTVTGRKYGVCAATVRPMPRQCGCPNPCGECGITLHNPLVSVDEIKIDGTVFTDWYLINGHKLFRSDDLSWPHSQKLGKADTQPDTFSVTYTFGVDPPLGVARATLELGVQFYLNEVVDPRCELPMGTTSVSRQGMSVTLDVERVLATSNQTIAGAINIFNPTGDTMPSDVWASDDHWELFITSA